MAVAENALTKLIKRREVWLADLRTGTIGSEQGGIRPVLIISNDKNNMYSTAVTVVPLTSKQNKNKIPTHVLLENETYLTEVSIALVEQVRTIDKARLIKKMGETSEIIMIEVEKALEIQTDLHKPFSYDEAFDMLAMIQKIKRSMKELGKQPILVELFQREVDRFDKYCRKHNKNMSEIKELYIRKAKENIL